MIPPIAALLSWPAIVYVFSRTRTVAATILFSILGGYLFLPEQSSIDLPALYELNKISIPAYTALILCVFAVSGTSQPGAIHQAQMGTNAWRAGWFPQATLPRTLLIMLVVGAVMTVLTNRDAIIGVDGVLPGLRLYDAGSSILVAFVTIIPLLLGRKFLAHPDGQRLVLQGFCIAGTIYGLLALFEVRMSPQLSNWTYGVSSSLWLQHVRGDGYRPLVFLSHGLRVSIFLAAALITTVGLARLYVGKPRIGFMVVSTFLFLALVLSKSLGALMIALVLCPIMLFMPRRLLFFAMAGIVSVALLYPVLRGTAIIPLDGLVNFATSISEERAHSLSYRFYFEGQLLERAQERPFFGWGGWGRNLYLGREDAVPDGEWIIVLGRDGWTGFIGRFGLMFFPVVILLWRWRRDGIGMESAVIAAALTAAAVDLIPNSGLTPDKWLLAGSLWGRLEMGRITETANEEVPDPPPVRFRYRRRGPAPSLDTTPPPVITSASDTPSNRYTRQTRRIDTPPSRSRTRKQDR